MTTFFNKFKIRLLQVLLVILIGFFTLISCDKEELDIQKDFPFEVKVMPVPTDIAIGDTVEIRITVQRSGNYAGTQYSIRYFQFDGQGTLRYFDDPPYQPNDLYSLPVEQFRLYYTSQSVVSQSFDIWISDNFGNEKQISFQFNSTD